MAPPQRWRGAWVTQFESEHFCPGDAFECSSEKHEEYDLWFDKKVFTDRPQIRAKVNRKYALDFIGRRTEYPIAGWGRRYEIIVDHMISMKDVGPLAGLPQEKD
jgi:hypothetical protein